MMSTDNRISPTFRQNNSPLEPQYESSVPVRKRRPVSCPTSRLRARAHAAKHGYSNNNQLKPYFDASAGLDKWPAQIGSHPPQSISKQICVIDPAGQTRTQTRLGHGKTHTQAPRPRFLDQIEHFVHTELRKLGVPNSEPSELRLQVYREAFDLLIHDFRTYQPILSSIKNEYDKILSQQREQIRQLLPLKQMLVTQSDVCEQRLMEAKVQERQDLVMLRGENERLYVRIDSLEKSELQLETQVSHLLEELGAEYHRLRDETDARKLLVAQLNDFRIAQDDFSLATQSYIDDHDREKNDPVILQYALRGARKREKQLTVRVDELEKELSAYSDVVSIKEYNEVKDHNNQLKKQLTELQQESNKLGKNYDVLYEKFAEIREKKEKLKAELDNLEQKALTPRPDWDICADHVDGGMMRWKQVSRGKHSEELLPVIIKELNKTNKSTTGQDRRSSSSSTCRTEKAQGNIRGDDGLLMVACQLSMVIAKHDMSDGKDDAHVKKDDFKRLLYEFFPNKEEDLINSLYTAAESQLKAKACNDFVYPQLFWEDDNGRLGQFLEELSAQYYKERREYVEEIWEELADTNPVSVEDLRRAITIIDPEITPEDLEKYLCYAFMVSHKDNLGETEPMELHALLLRLQRGMLRRIGKLIG